SIAFDGEAMTLSQVLYSLWLGANLQAKITRSATPLESALAHAKQIIAAPAV
ncbi:TetR/AcrR family transcriptional regulator, partial [Klebsiella pneumoniae]|nr:TetR/AcrR family transcriptional regulator [Klebsiella pneumoniae]